MDIPAKNAQFQVRLRIPNFSTISALNGRNLRYPGIPGFSRSHGLWALDLVFCQAWPSGYVPFPLECWPRSGSVLKHCGKEEASAAAGWWVCLLQATLAVVSQVIQDVSSGLVGACQNMEQLTVASWQ